jgi:DNA repair protein RadA/Sms
MARASTTYVCSACATEAPRWLGAARVRRVEHAGRADRARRPPRAATRGRRAPRRPPGRAGRRPSHGAPRLQTGIGELDRVLGGGFVPGSVVLLGGSPGIGKSTLTGMALGNLARGGRRVLYVSGEESPEQVRLRAERLPEGRCRCPVLAETTSPRARDARHEPPEVCVIDSVQTLHADELTGAAGLGGQVREVADRITRLAKARSIAVVLVGHVTKDGALAGPRVLEHLVDCVLQFEGERERTYRTLRALKNRFGSTNDCGRLRDALGRPGGGPGRLGPLRRRGDPGAGSVVLAAMEGSRPLLVEVQALVSPSELVPPRRVVNGIDRNRLALVLAVLARHAGVGVGSAGRLRQRRRRRAGRRARRGPGGGPGGRERRPRRPARGRARPRRARLLLRRGGADG